MVWERPRAYCISSLKVLKESLKFNEANAAAHTVSTSLYLGILIRGHMEMINVTNYPSVMPGQIPYWFILFYEIIQTKLHTSFISGILASNCYCFELYPIHPGRVPVSWLQ